MKLKRTKRFSYGLLFILWLCLILTPQPIAASDDEPAKPLKLTIKEAIMLALENNSAFKIEKLNPVTRESQLLQEESAFAPTTTAGVSKTDTSGDQSGNSTGVSTGISVPLTTGGDISLDLSTDKKTSSSGDYASSLDLGFTQPLLKGAGSSVALANIRKAEISLLTSKYELQAYAESLVAQVEATYRDLALAQQQLKIYEDSLSLAQQQLEETQVMVDVGKTAAVELVAAKAEVASRKEALINARSNIAKTKLRLLRLVNLPDIDFFYQEIELSSPFDIPSEALSTLETHVETALKMRPDLNQAKLQIDKNEIDLVTTRNGVLPQLDLFISLGMTNYADSFSSSVGDVLSGSRDLRAGLNFSQVLGNQNNKQRYRQTLISKEQNDEALKNLTQLAKEDVGGAWIEVNRSLEQIQATKATRELQEEKLRAETEKYRVGKSTSLLVAQAQRDFLASQIAEIQSIANYQKALIELYRLEGTLLQRNGISYLD